MSTKIVIAIAVAATAAVADNIDAAKFREEVFPLTYPGPERDLEQARKKTNKRIARQLVFTGIAFAAGFVANREIVKMIK